MKNKFDNRKEFERIAAEIGIPDRTVNVVYTNPITKKESLMLVNNQRRFVNGMLKLSYTEQLEKIVIFNEKMTELIQAQAEARADMEKEVGPISMENPSAAEALAIAAAPITNVEDPFNPII